MCCAWLLVSLVIDLKSLHEQSSVTLAPLAIVAPGMCKDPVIFQPLRFNLAGQPIKSLVMLALPHTYDYLKSLKLI